MVEHLGDADGVLVVDETGFLKKGKKSAGVANQYSGAAHGLATSQVGVFLLYVSARGAAFLDRDLYVPEEWLTDPVRCREAGIPADRQVISKGELAKGMLARAFATNVPADWVVGDTLYGYDELRSWLEEQQKSYVLAIPETHLVWVDGRQQPIRYLAALLPNDAWAVRIAQGKAAKDPGSLSGPGSRYRRETSPRRMGANGHASCCYAVHSLIPANGRTTALPAQRA